MEPVEPRFETLAERRIRQAMAEGWFEHLEGAGHPIPDLDDDPDWWVKRWLRRWRQDEAMFEAERRRRREG